MTKKLLSMAVLCMASLPVFAGGYLTNTNHSVSFLRMPAQNAVISANSAYFNPAGVGFLNNGWHMSVGIQNVHQTREITSTYAPFASGINNNGQDTKTFKGLSYVPVLPSFDLAYVHDNWFASINFGVYAGGGKADFEHGLGSFEGQIAQLHYATNYLSQTIFHQTPFQGYDADIDLVGEQYYAGGQLNIGYKINEHLSVSGGARVMYVTCSSQGSVANIQFKTAKGIVPANIALGGLVKMAGEHPELSKIFTPEVVSKLENNLATYSADKEINCSQSDWTIAPIIGIDYKTDQFNFAARYEFKTVVNLTNKTVRNDLNLPEYKDGERFRRDVPALLSLGVQYSPRQDVRLNLDFNKYFDKYCKQYNNITFKNDKQDNLKTNPYEIIFGAEYDINKKFTVSGGAQRTVFGFGKNGEYVSDMNFSVSSWSLGFGGRYNINNRMSIDLAILTTLYDKYTKEMSDYNGIAGRVVKKVKEYAGNNPALGQMIPEEMMVKLMNNPGKDVYHRTSFDVGIGFNYSF